MWNLVLIIDITSKSDKISPIDMIFLQDDRILKISKTLERNLIKYNLKQI